MHLKAALRHIAPIIRSHHEWYDGSGYPDGLKGEDIPYLSRIIAIAEAYAAMISELPFYRTLPEDEAGRRLKASAGSQFDPLLVEAFYRLELG